MPQRQSVMSESTMGEADCVYPGVPRARRTGMSSPEATAESFPITVAIRL
jgi:hypothetical protein